MSVSGEGMVLLVSLVVGAVWLVLYAWLDSRYRKGRQEVLDEQEKYYSWIHTKSLDDLIIHKATPMISILTASGNSHTMTSKHYKEHKDHVVIESSGAILHKNHIEQFTYFWLGEGVLTHENINSSKRQVVMFKAKGKDFASLDNIEWVITYGLREFANYQFLRRDEGILKYTSDRDEWESSYARNYSEYYEQMNKIAKEGVGFLNEV